MIDPFSAPSASPVSLRDEAAVVVSTVPRSARQRLPLNAALVVVILLSLGVTAGCYPGDREDSPPRSHRGSDIFLAHEADVLRALVPQRTTLAALLRSHDLLAQEIGALVARAGKAFDLRRVRAGQPYQIERRKDGRIHRFEYEIDLERRLVVGREDHADAVFRAEIAAIPRTLTAVTVEGTISRATPSLVQALDAAGERLELSLAMADVFSGEVDFTSDLQSGDQFRLLVERAERDDGTFAGYGPILAAEFDNDGRRLTAIRFTPPGGKPGHYDEQGRSLKRLFLKSPLRFEPRVTSAFSRARRHPILNLTRAHNGVDYSAPTGAPVVAVSSGVVTLAGWTNGGGRTVRIRHTSGYESEYLHLSAIAAGVGSGVRVAQGALIGRVGATGLATAPHLHYGLRKNGAYVNPLREHQNMPPGEPVPALHLAAFGRERDRVMLRLTQIATRAN
ncbi:MAG: M23 family metallopeptidase [Acidobacteriota bacterium]